MSGPGEAHLNVAAYLPDMAQLQPDALAVAVADGRTSGGDVRYTRMTARDLDNASSKAAHALSAAGVRPGMRTVLMVTPGPAFFAITFALFRMGAVPVMVNPGMGIKNLKQCLAEAEPEAFIGVTKAHVARAILRWAGATLKVKVTVGRRLFWGGASYERLVAAAPEAPFPIEEVTPEQMAGILFTSGSTGVPKGAVYTHGIFSSQVRLLKQMYGIAPGEVDLSTFPLFALFGPALGMASVVPEMDASKPGEADPALLFDAIARFSCTNVFVNPALVEKLGRYGAANKIKLPSVKRVLSAGAPARPDALRRFLTMLEDGVEIFTPYGATESLPVASIGSAAILGETAARTALGEGVCVGTPVKEMEAVIIGISDDPIPTWSDDLVLEDGQIGEIVVKGPVVTSRYYNRDASTRGAKIKDGDGQVRHRMGDLGYFDDQGRIWMCGRKAHRVVDGERTWFTVPCEAVFNVHEDVYRTALVGVARGGRTTPVICVELEAGRSAAGVVEALAALGAAHPHTASIEHFLIHQGGFPVDVRHNAKIFREKLAIWATSELARA